MITSESGDAIVGDLAREVGMPVTPLDSTADSHNAHFRASSSSGVPVFVKCFDDVDYWRRAIAAAPIAQAGFPRTPRLLEYGTLGTDRWWSTYEWIDLLPFVATPSLLEEIGATIGRLHASTRGEIAGFDRHDVDAEIADRAAILADADAAAADRILTLQHRWGSAPLPAEGLIHGDFHWRNVGLAAGGQPVLFDTENMQAGHPLLDFGKLLDLDDLAPGADHDAFFAGYWRHAALAWPSEAFRFVQLWVTAGVLVYSTALGLQDFAAHGYRRLSELEALS